MAKNLFLAAALAAGLCAATPGLAADGKAIYESTCVACHATGVANAPKLGDKAAWAPRLAAGKAALQKSVAAGKGAMPPRAGNPKLSDNDIQAAVDHMLASLK